MQYVLQVSRDCKLEMRLPFARNENDDDDDGRRPPNNSGRHILNVIYHSMAILTMLAMAAAYSWYQTQGMSWCKSCTDCCCDTTTVADTDDDGLWKDAAISTPTTSAIVVLDVADVEDFAI
jgi:hypothetical protein